MASSLGRNPPGTMVEALKVPGTTHSSRVFFFRGSFSGTQMLRIENPYGQQVFLQLKMSGISLGDDFNGRLMPGQSVSLPVTFEGKVSSIPPSLTVNAFVNDSKMTPTPELNISLDQGTGQTSKSPEVRELSLGEGLRSTRNDVLATTYSIDHWSSDGKASIILRNNEEFPIFYKVTFQGCYTLGGSLDSGQIPPRGKASIEVQMDSLTGSALCIQSTMLTTGEWDDLQRVWQLTESSAQSEVSLSLAKNDEATSCVLAYETGHATRHSRIAKYLVANCPAGNYTLQLTNHRRDVVCYKLRVFGATIGMNARGRIAPGETANVSIKISPASRALQLIPVVVLEALTIPDDVAFWIVPIHGAMDNLLLLKPAALAVSCIAPKQEKNCSEQLDEILQFLTTQKAAKREYTERMEEAAAVVARIRQKMSTMDEGERAKTQEKLEYWDGERARHSVIMDVEKMTGGYVKRLAEMVKQATVPPITSVEASNRSGHIVIPINDEPSTSESMDVVPSSSTAHPSSSSPVEDPLEVLLCMNAIPGVLAAYSVTPHQFSFLPDRLDRSVIKKMAEDLGRLPPDQHPHVITILKKHNASPDASGRVSLSGLEMEVLREIGAFLTATFMSLKFGQEEYMEEDEDLYQEGPSTDIAMDMEEYRIDFASLVEDCRGGRGRDQLPRLLKALRQCRESLSESTERSFVDGKYREAEQLLGLVRGLLPAGDAHVEDIEMFEWWASELATKTLYSALFPLTFTFNVDPSAFIVTEYSFDASAIQLAVSRREKDSLRDSLLLLPIDKHRQAVQLLLQHMGRKAEAGESSLIVDFDQLPPLVFRELEMYTRAAMEEEERRKTRGRANPFLPSFRPLSNALLDMRLSKVKLDTSAAPTFDIEYSFNTDDFINDFVDPEAVQKVLSEKLAWPLRRLSKDRHGQALQIKWQSLPSAVNDHVSLDLETLEVSALRELEAFLDVVEKDNYDMLKNPPPSDPVAGPSFPFQGLLTASKRIEEIKEEDEGENAKDDEAKPAFWRLRCGMSKDEEAFVKPQWLQWAEGDMRESIDTLNKAKTSITLLKQRKSSLSRLIRAHKDAQELVDRINNILAEQFSNELTKELVDEALEIKTWWCSELYKKSVKFTIGGHSVNNKVKLTAQRISWNGLPKFEQYDYAGVPPLFMTTPKDRAQLAERLRSLPAENHFQAISMLERRGVKPTRIDDVLEVDLDMETLPMNVFCELQAFATAILSRVPRVVVPPPPPPPVSSPSPPSPLLPLLQPSARVIHLRTDGTARIPVEYSFDPDDFVGDFAFMEEVQLQLSERLIEPLSRLGQEHHAQIIQIISKWRDDRLLIRNNSIRVNLDTQTPPALRELVAFLEAVEKGTPVATSSGSSESSDFSVIDASDAPVQPPPEEELKFPDRFWW